MEILAFLAFRGVRGIVEYVERALIETLHPAAQKILKGGRDVQRRKKKLGQFFFRP